jgi:hypothetical protein
MMIIIIKLKPRFCQEILQNNSAAQYVSLPFLLLARLSPRRSRFAPVSVCGFCDGQSDTGTDFFSKSLVLSRQYHTAVALHTHVQSGR